MKPIAAQSASLAFEAAKPKRSCIGILRAFGDKGIGRQGRALGCEGFHHGLLDLPQKSMTSYADHTIWQDVYQVPHEGVVLYVKFTVDVEGHLLISLKEK